nr:hypothetical protein [Tanacetum cinerariifolium]
SQVKSSYADSSSSSEIAKLTHAVNQQTSVVTTAMTAILKQFQATPPPAFIKSVKEIYVTCGGAHPYYQCLIADGNTFLEFQDNIQGYVLAATVNYNKDKIKESKLLIDELDPPRLSDFLPSPEYDSVLYEDFSEVDALPSTNNEDKVFNLGILIHENLFEVTIRVTPDNNVKKISISNASLILEDFNPPLYELPFHKEVLGSETLLSFSSENEEKKLTSGFSLLKEFVLLFS